MPVSGPYCSGCINQPNGVVRIEPDGLGKLGLMLIGDSPWKDEVAAGKNFQGASGRYITRQLARLGLNRNEHFTIANSMWCKPPTLGWTDNPEKHPEAQLALNQCRPYLDNFIRQRQPRCIITLGGVALQRVCNVDGLHNRHAYVHTTSYGIPAIPTFHPSHIIQGNQKLTVAFLFAIRRAQEIASGSYRPTKLELIEDPSAEELEGYVRYHQDADGSIAWMMTDIETPESGDLDEEQSGDDASYHIIRAGFSLSEGSAVTFPWVQPFINLYLGYLARAKQVQFWNEGYDMPRLRQGGASLQPDVTVIDAMEEWHFLQSDLPKALGFVAPFYYAGEAWKHLNGLKPAFYNCCDNAIQSVCEHGIRTDLKREGRWDAFMRHCVETKRILASMGRIKIDEVERGHTGEQPEHPRSGFMGRMADEQDIERAEIDKLVPPSLHQIKVWKRKPQDPEAKLRYLPHGDQQPLVLGSGEQVSEGIPQWYKDLGFNPNSHLQVKELIRHYGLKVPHKRGEADKETTDAKYLKRFIKYPIFKHIVAWKQRDKLISTYNWPLDAQGMVHTTYGFHPSTWRKSSRNVNLQNAPKRGDLAEAYRRMIIAEDGHVLIEGDSSAIEAVLLGYFANSQRYIDLAKAGVHGWFTSHVIGKPIDYNLPLAELTKACKAMKKADKVTYEMAKRCIHGSNYLLSAFGMYDEYMEFFESEAACSKLQALYFSLPPGQEVKAWQIATMQEAHETNKLLIPYGYKHYFYDVFHWDPKRHKETYGDDAKRAVAFRPQACASAVQTEILLRLAAIPGIIEHLRLIVHDSFVCSVPQQLADWFAPILYREMTAPLSELGGLTIGAEITWGWNLAPYDAERNPGGMREWTLSH